MHFITKVKGKRVILMHLFPPRWDLKTLHIIQTMARTIQNNFTWWPWYHGSQKIFFPEDPSIWVYQSGVCKCPSSFPNYLFLVQYKTWTSITVTSQEAWCCGLGTKSAKQSRSENNWRCSNISGTRSFGYYWR